MDELREFALQVVRDLNHAGHQAYWAGGCVRDQLLGNRPKDYDVATDATPDKIRTVFGRRRTLAIGAAFGVITVLGPKGIAPIEVATFRQDAEYSDGRHPDRVRFSSATEDARRRDFTVNGLFYDPLEDRVIDFVGGLADLKAGILRCIGNPHDRLREDKLRMLRAVRFSATLGFHIDPESLAAIRIHADEIECVSAERIAMEMRRLLAHADRSTGIQLLRSTGLVRQVLPEYVSVSSPVHGDVQSRCQSILKALPEAPFPVSLAALLWPLTSTGTAALEQCVDEISTRWKLSNDERERMKWYLSYEEAVRGAHQARWPSVQRLLIHPWIDQLLTLAEAVSNSLKETPEGVEFCRRKLAVPPFELNPPELLDGHDLLAAGIPAGPHFRTILAAIRDAQLEGRLATKPAAIETALRMWNDG